MFPPDIRTEDPTEDTETDGIEYSKAEESQEKVPQGYDGRDYCHHEYQVQSTDTIWNERNPAGYRTSPSSFTPRALRLEVPRDTPTEHSREREKRKEDRNNTTDQSITEEIR